MNKVNFARRVVECTQTIFYWVFILLVYDIIRYAGNTVDFNEFWVTIEVVIFVGIATGIFYYVLESIMDLDWARRKSYGFRIGIKSGLFTGIFIIDILLGADLLALINRVEVGEGVIELWKNGIIISFLIYFFTASTFFSFWKIVNENFGPSVFWNLVVGLYSPPRTEKKIFMFLDMRDSTTIAEKLGYTKFSKLVQDSFLDLNSVMAKFNGEIYKYVGDEAIIVWDYDQGKSEQEAVKLFFDFQQVLKKKEDYYSQNYGLLPEFKAGIHGGEVIVAEVGVERKEIAYLGDVVNTTARIQDQCNHLKENFLVSSILYDDLEQKVQFHYSYKGEHVLKGKEANLELYGIHKLLIQ
jgi:adenylate cyclase